MKDDLQSSLSLFADDNLMHISSNSDETNKNILSSDFGIMRTWADQWLIKFSVEKTKSMFVRYQGNADDKLIFINHDLDNVSEYNPLRNRSNLSCPTFRTETYRKLFFPSMTLFWNNLEKNIKHLEKMPLKTWKTHLTKHKPKCNPYYYLGNRQFNIIMARLRMRCSELRQHLFDMNIMSGNNYFNFFIAREASITLLYCFNC